jgi:predicted transport protein
MRFLTILLAYACLVVFFFIPPVLKAQDSDWTNSGSTVNPPNPGNPVPADGSSSNGNGSDSADQNTNFMSRSFVFGVCMNTYDISSACMQSKIGAAQMRLGTQILANRASNYLDYKFQIAFPDIYSRYKQMELLVKIETDMVSMVAKEIQKDILNAEAISWPTEAEKERARLIIQQDELTLGKWQKEAMGQANAGTNWTYNYHRTLEWKYDDNLHFVFSPSAAYQQLLSITSVGWAKR